MSIGQPADRWDGGDDYDRFMGRWSRPVATRFVEWLDLPPGSSWLDVGCGTGALLGAIAAGASPSRLAGVDPSEQFLAIAAHGLPDAELRIGTAEQIPFEPSGFDAVVSGLVLNFVADPAAALGSFGKACRPGGQIGAYVWDYAEGMRFLRIFWDAATDLDREALVHDEGRGRFTMCDPDRLAALFADAGLGAVETTAIDVERKFGSFDEYWQPFLAGQGPAGTYLVNLPDAARSAVAEEVRRRLPVAPDGSIRLAARAWAVRGRTAVA